MVVLLFLLGLATIPLAVILLERFSWRVFGAGHSWRKWLFLFLYIVSGFIGCYLAVLLCAYLVPNPSPDVWGDWWVTFPLLCFVHGFSIAPSAFVALCAFIRYIYLRSRVVRP